MSKEETKNEILTLLMKALVALGRRELTRKVAARARYTEDAQAHIQDAAKLVNIRCGT